MDLSPANQPDPNWSTAVLDWEDRIRSGRSLIPDLPLYNTVAEKALRIFKRLRVPDLIGTPTYGEVCEDWVFDLVRVIFGSYDPDTKRRMLREFFLLVPKKNGKSAIAAAIIVTAAILNERPMAELLLIAPTQKISNIAFKQAKGIIALDDGLSDIFRVQDHKKEITHIVTEAVIMILSADGDVVTGSKATYILVDETHVLAGKPKAAEIFVEIRGGLASRPEGFMLQITTQSKKPPVGQFKEELDMARAVRDGEIDLPMLAILYELPRDLFKDNGWRKESTWGMVNPNLDRSVSLNYLRDELIKADRKGADALALFASQHLNVEVGEGLKQDRWVGGLYWSNTKIENFGFDELLDRSEVVVAGIDGGGLDDLLGAAFVGREKVTKNWLSWCKGWAHPIVFERRASISVQLQDFAKSGDLTICEYPTQDEDEVAELLQRANETGLLPDTAAVGLDPEGVAALIDAAITAGLTDEQLCAVSQGYRLNGAIKGAERRLRARSLLHADQPMMDWCISNAKTEPRGNAVIVTKAASGTAKIDPVMALFNGVTLMARNPQPSTRANLDDFLSKPVMAL
ncbi:terminase [Sedimentitalea sp. CY04]|uniref:Terminase n=1 Tax=Parasedimentitalea denitrificans TaxID=2211118 RepID=A0ABX0WC90_9RHOB|nr:terminase large subunit [Sedimentitalea sp. CY04]NIZ63296.1 terminase [Sedimentitalea sp. CY04]